MDKKPIKGEYLEVLLRSPQTIFSSKDVALMWREENENIIKNRLNKYVKSGKLFKVRRGLFAKDKNYNRYELATRINTPSYVSFETVLGASGMTFQYYGNIFVASYIKREMEVDGQKIEFVRMKDYVLSNTLGIENSDGYARATKERAYLDRIYVSKKYYFDNLNSLDWEKVFEILPIYHNKRLEKTVKKYYDYFIKSEEENKIKIFKDTLIKCIKMLEKMDNKHILNGLGELLTQSQKDWAREKLKSETIFLLKLNLDNEK